MRVSPELNLILTLTEDLYGKTVVAKSGERINWNKFVMMAFDNKLSQYVLKKIIDEKTFEIEGNVHARLVALKENGDLELWRFGETLRDLDRILGKDSYLLVKTYKGYPSVTHDLDVLVRDLKKARTLFEAKGWRITPIVENFKFGFVKKDFLVVELHERIGWGSISNLFDGKLHWSGNRSVTIEGVEARLPSVEADLLTLIAHMNFQVYAVLLGELLYIYYLSSLADWELINTQVKEHGWLRSFYNSVGILNGLHRTLYGTPSPIEEHLPMVTQTKLRFPYVFNLREAYDAVTAYGLVNIFKLAGYLPDRLKPINRSLAAAYCDVVLGRLGSFFITHFRY